MKKWKQPEKTIGGKDKAAGKIARFIIRLQKGFAVFMTRRTAHLSVTTFKTLLIVFLITGGALNIWLVVESLHKNSSVLQGMQAGQLKFSTYRVNDSLKSIQSNTDLFISPAQYRRLQWYGRFMDSLKANPSGHHIYDSIVQLRPGMVDSVKMLLKIYNKK